MTEFWRKAVLTAMIMMMLMPTTIDAGICGNRGQCRCSRSGDVICHEVEDAPFFTVQQRHGKRLTITTNDNFNVRSLDLTEGFDRVMLIGPSAIQCKDAAYDYPWVTCSTETRSYRPSRRTTEFLQTTTPSDSLTTKDSTTESETTVPQKEKDQKKNGSDGRVLALIVWNAIWSFLGFIAYVCIMVSLVNFHERINTYTPCGDGPMFAVNCWLGLMAVCMIPFHCCAPCCKRCPMCCVRAVDRCTRGQTSGCRAAELQELNASRLVNSFIGLKRLVFS